MVKRLSETGLIEHVPYSGVQAHLAGPAGGAPNDPPAPILELYLTQHLGTTGGVHAEAERLEHAVSDERSKRMASALGTPPIRPAR